MPFERIAWDGRWIGTRVYHSWLIQRTASGCHVCTEETQNGVMTRAHSTVFPRRKYLYHQVWLENLNEKAKNEPPPP